MHVFCSPPADIIKTALCCEVAKLCKIYAKIILVDGC